jgi:hypothetical protein
LQHKAGAVNPVQSTFSGSVPTVTIPFGNYIVTDDPVNNAITVCALFTTGCGSAYSGTRFSHVSGTLIFTVNTNVPGGFSETACLRCTAPSGSKNFDNFKYKLFIGLQHKAGVVNLVQSTFSGSIPSVMIPF